MAFRKSALNFVLGMISALTLMLLMEQYNSIASQLETSEVFAANATKFVKHQLPQEMKPVAVAQPVLSKEQQVLKEKAQYLKAQAGQDKFMYLNRKLLLRYNDNSHFSIF